MFVLVMSAVLPIVVYVRQAKMLHIGGGGFGLKQ